MFLEGNQEIIHSRDWQSLNCEGHLHSAMSLSASRLSYRGVAWNLLIRINREYQYKGEMHIKKINVAQLY